MMNIEIYNLYTHFIFNTLKREKLIPEANQVRIEKYSTGLFNNNSCKLYAIYVNPEQVHFSASRSPALTEEQLATIIADSSERFVNANKLAGSGYAWQRTASAFSV